MTQPRPKEPKLRIGLLRLTDSAPAIVAEEFGYFADEGIDAELSMEPSWANIADKLTYGFLDAAIVVPPLAFAVSLGLRGVAEPLIVPHVISLGGNSITLQSALTAKVRALAARDNLIMPQAFAALLRAEKLEGLSLGVVHTYSTHNLLLRYWLAAGGLNPDRDVRLSVIPPSLAVEALRSGKISGFCAGAPWGNMAERAGVGAPIASSKDIWRNAPEKVFAVRARWIDDHPDALIGAQRALLRAAQFCDAPENASYTGALLSRGKYLNVDSHAVISSLPGGSISPDSSSYFFRHATNFPWASQAIWILEQMKRWNLVPADMEASAVVAQIYRPDLFRAAAASLGLPAPLADRKSEGTHAADWSIESTEGNIAMGPDTLCDGATFSA